MDAQEGLNNATARDLLQAYYLDLPHTQIGDASAWNVRWKRYGLTASIATSPLVREEDGESARKRPRLDTQREDWLRSGTPDAIDRARAALQTSPDGYDRFMTVNAHEKAGEIERELWLFDLSADEPGPGLDGLTELSSGTFDFETLFPSVSSSTRTLARNAPRGLLDAYEVFTRATRERVIELLLVHTQTKFEAMQCGDSLLVKGDDKSLHSCRPLVSLCERGVRVQLDMHTSSLRPFSSVDELEEGAALVLAPTGLKCDFVRLAATSKTGERHVVARARLSRDANATEEQLWWPAAKCFVVPTEAKSSLHTMLDKDRHRHRQTLERKQLATASYIEAVARERERERRERQLALAKQQFGVNTPSSNVNTPTPLFEEVALASTPNSMAAQTPQATGPSVTASPAQARQALPADPLHDLLPHEDVNQMDWHPWPMQQSHFDDIGGGTGAFDLGLNDADFSFFDDMPDGGLSELAMDGDGETPGLDASSITPAPSLITGPSPSLPYDHLNASSTSAESPNGRTPHTPFTPFAYAIDTEQTDLAVPSPTAPFVHFPPTADPGFGAIDFDEEESFSPPHAAHCAKHGRLHVVSSPPDMRKSGKRTFSMLQRSVRADRQSALACACEAGRRSDGRTRSQHATPHSDRIESDILAPAEDASSEDESEVDEAATGDSLPADSPLLERLGVSGAALLNEVVPTIASHATGIVAAMRPPERFKFECFIASLTDVVLHLLLDAPSANEAAKGPSLAVDAFSHDDSALVQPVTGPQLRLCRRDAVLDVDQTALRFWQKLELSPWSGEKPVMAYVLDMTCSDADPSILLRCAQQIGEKYEASAFGKHALGKVSFNSDIPGVLRWPADLEAEGVKAALRDAGKRVMLSAFEAKVSTVLYITRSATFPDRSEQIYHVHRDMFAQSGHGAPSCIGLPGSSIAQLDAMMVPPASGDASDSWAFRIALSSYERIRVSAHRMRLHPEGMVEARWPRMFNQFFAPAFALAQTPATPKFAFEWPARQYEVLERGRLLYVAYAVSDDWEWVCTSTADDAGQDRNLRVVWIGTGKASQAERNKKLCDMIITRILWDVLPASKVEWSLVLLRVGTMASEELHGLKDRLNMIMTKVKTSVEVTVGSLQPAELSIGAGKESELCLIRRQGFSAGKSDSVLSSASATVATASSRPLFDMHLFYRTSTAAFASSTPKDEEHHDRIFESVAKMTSSWRHRGPARTARSLPWFADIVDVFRRETSKYIAAAPQGTFASPTT